MGCDIHCYVEYRKKSDDRWRDFGGRINPGRNYCLFGAMAGVRTGHIPFIIPRGCPQDCASEAFGDNTIYVSDTQDEDFTGSGSEYCYSRKHAEECVDKGHCEWVELNGHKSWVTNSDYHSHSWLNADEFELAIASYLKASGFQINVPRISAPSALVCDANTEKAWALESITEYWAVLASMRCLETQGMLTRLIFWFDN